MQVVREVTVRGSLDEIEDETLAVLAVRRGEIQEGRLDDTPWFFAITSQVSDILRRRRTAENRRLART